MKQIVCEMCGSNKMLKKDGIYECQYCGCQYTLEEARKLIVEGTVKIDDSDKAINWIKLADTAYKNSNWKEAYSYYCKVLEVYPEEWHSIYRKALSTGWQSTLGNIHARETIGGISDGFKTLLASDNTNDFKASGIVSMEKDLMSWVAAVQSASVEHASEYTKTLESACYDYYQRSILMASTVEFAISLFDKFTVMNIEDLDLADGVFSLLVKASGTIATALCTKFRPLVGKTYSTFWQVYVDDYRDVYPTGAAKSAYSQLRIATDKLKQEYPQWKHERLVKDNPDYDREMIYKAALKKKDTDDIESLETAVGLFEKTTGYKDSEKLATECRERILAKKYLAAVEKKNIGSYKSLNEAAAQFEEISDYKDSSSLAGECKVRIEELTLIKEKKKKRLIAVGLAAVVVFVFFGILGEVFTGKGTESNTADLDMSTSLIKNGMPIPACDAYELLEDRILTELGSDYASEFLENNIDCIYKKGETSCIYAIECLDDSDLPKDSNLRPDTIVITDATANSPNPDSLAKLIGFFLDNETPATVLPVLQNHISSFPNKTYPKSFMLSLNKKLFYVVTLQNTYTSEDMLGLMLFADYFDYTKLDPATALFTIFYPNVSEETVTQLTTEQAEYLLNYYMDHELDYFADLDSLIEQSGINNNPELSLE